MGNQVCKGKPIIDDPEQDPEVIARRTALFEKHVMPFCNMIYKLCMKYSFNSSNVQENYVEVLVNFYRRIETYNPDRPIRTWLHIVTKRQVYTLEKKRMAENNKDHDIDIDNRFDEIVDEDRISSNVMCLENYRELYNDDILAALDELRPCYRDALLLQESGCALKEIAEIEYRRGSLKSKNIETVKSRLRIARDFLKTRLTRDGKRIPCATNN